MNAIANSIVRSNGDTNRIGSVLESHGRVRAEIGSLTSQMDELEKRLVAVLKSNPPQQAGEEKTAQQSICELSDNLYSDANAIAKLNMQLRSIIDRLEL